MEKIRKESHSSKVSYGLLGFIFLVFYGPLLPDLFNGTFNIGSIGLIAFLTLIFTFISTFFFNTTYTIDHNQLRIKCGILSWDPIDIAEIKEISKTKSIIASPAPSFDRLLIKYGKMNEIIISPKDELLFAQNLLDINPSIINNI